SKDAGEIGAGHVVTALYEIVPRGTWDQRLAPVADTLRYRKDTARGQKSGSGKESGSGKGTGSGKETGSKVQDALSVADELFFVNLNYKNPDEETSTTSPSLHIPVKDIAISGQVQSPSRDFMWAASVASFGMQLRNSKYSGTWTLADVLETVQGSAGEDELRVEFAELVKTARSLTGPRPVLHRPQVPHKNLAPAVELTPAEARRKASLSNKYRRLLKKIEVPDDLQSFGGFYEYGTWEGRAYAGHTELPQGYWVYVFPNWYIWGEEVPTDGTPQSPPDGTPSSSSDDPDSR
ncbi:MAG: YfbK domain-containing protein, partial [Planctomycetaceae bacterium]